jgi:hypothetical protein
VSETVKFTCQQVPREIGAFTGFAELNEYRRKLRELGMIGVDANGIGFGNLSIRDGATSRFYITGSGTGGTADLIPSDYARVVAYDFAENWSDARDRPLRHPNRLRTRPFTNRSQQFSQ